MKGGGKGKAFGLGPFSLLMISVPYSLLPREVLPPKHILSIPASIVHGMAVIVGLTAFFLVLNLAALLYYRRHKIIRFSQGNILQGR